MTSEEVKVMNTVPDILNRYGVQVKHGRCKAICHSGDGYTAKVSRYLYYCFKCNRSMDIFDITMHFNNCNFTGAMELLGGSERPSFTTIRKAKSAMRERNDRMVRQKEIELNLRGIRMYITAYRSLIASSEPFSDLWCYCINKLQYEIYLLEFYSERGENPAGNS